MRGIWVGLALLPAAFLFAAPARSQNAAPSATLQSDSDLIHRLDQLTRQKGYKDIELGQPVCQNLGLGDGHDNCKVYQAPYPDKAGFIHAFNIYDEPGSGTVRIILYKRNDKAVTFYVLGLDSVLEKAAAEKISHGQGAWSQIPNDRAAAGLRQELAYWRVQQTQLAKEPDRKN